MATASDQIVAEGTPSPKCTNCQEEGLSKEAYSFCFKCDSYFCPICDKFHGKIAPEHKVICGGDFYRAGEKKEFVPCSMHSKEHLGLYCQDHEIVICVVCKHVKHQSCSVQSILEAFGETDISQELNDVSKHVHTLTDSIEKMKLEQQSILDKNRKDTAEMRIFIRNIREQMNLLLDNYKDQVNARHCLNVSIQTDVINVCESMIDQLKMQTQSIERAKDFRTKELILLNQARQLCIEYTPTVEELSIKAKTNETMKENLQQFLIRQMSKIGHQGILNSVDVIEALHETSSNETLPDEKSFLDIKSCSFVQETDFKLPSDAKTPCVTGCCFCPDGKLIVCDNNNKKLKILNSDLNIKYTLPCDRGPWDVDCVDKSSIAVTLPSANSVQLISINPGVKLKETYDMGYECYGVRVHEKKIFVCINDYQKSKYGVKVLSEKGEEVTLIPTLGAGWLRYLCLNADGTKIYYTGGAGPFLFVNCITVEGYGIYSATSIKLRYPRGLICDINGNVIVCDDETKGVHIITSEGTVGNIVLTEKDGFGPKSLCLNKRNDSLVVGSYKKNASRLAVYKLEYEP